MENCIPRKTWHRECHGCVRMLVLWVKYVSLLSQLVVIWILYWLKKAKQDKNVAEMSPEEFFLVSENNIQKGEFFPQILLGFVNTILSTV